jgi:serine/threonine protein kinase
MCDMADEIQSNKKSLIGKVVADRYEVVSLIGHGAMGAVYKAKHTAIGRFFAVKTLNSRHGEDERSLKRFQQEAQAMSVLTHPNLIQISDYGHTEGGQPFFVMEYLEGVSLADHIKRNGPMPVALALPLFSQIADALAHAHSKNLIHRDLKPSNIMLIGDEQNFAKVVDLGIAKATADQDLHLTQTGEVFGSPLYMSPEQCQGMPVDGRSDVYSLGCLMYETLTAQPPLKGANFVQTAYKHMNEMPAPLMELRPDVSADVNSVVMACLAKNPDERVASMTALRDLIRQLEALICSESQQNTVAQQRTTLANTIKGATPQPAPKPVNKALIASCSVVAILFAALAMNKMQLHLSLRKAPPQPPIASAAMTSSPLPQVDFNTQSSISVESPLFKRDNPSAKEEIDVVAVYTAQPPTQELGKDEVVKPQNVEVNVHPAKEPITLVLFSYMPVHWSVKPFTGATIKKVIASGFHPQEVSGAGCSDVTKVCSKNRDQNAFHTGNIMTTDPNQVEGTRGKVYKQIQAGVYQLLGPDAEIRHFQGCYYGTHFDLEPEKSSSI